MVEVSTSEAAFPKEVAVFSDVRPIGSTSKYTREIDGSATPKKLARSLGIGPIIRNQRCGHDTVQACRGHSHMVRATAGKAHPSMKGACPSYVNPMRPAVPGSARWVPRIRGDLFCKLAEPKSDCAQVESFEDIPMCFEEC
jgi:hypothetical protein